eukprot:435053_1
MALILFYIVFTVGATNNDHLLELHSLQLPLIHRLEHPNLNAEVSDYASNLKDPDEIQSNMVLNELKNVTKGLWTTNNNQNTYTEQIDTEAQAWIDSLSKEQIKYYYNSFRDEYDSSESSDGNDDDSMLDVHDYVLYFKSYHLIWNNHKSWTWKTNYENNINTTVACSKQYPSLCINTKFLTNNNKIITQFKSLKIHYTDPNIPSNNIILDFWDDLDWSQVNILHHNDPNIHTDRRQLLRGAITSKYGLEYD